MTDVPLTWLEIGALNHISARTERSSLLVTQDSLRKFIMTHKVPVRELIIGEGGLVQYAGTGISKEPQPLASSYQGKIMNPFYSEDRAGIDAARERLLALGLIAHPRGESGGELGNYYVSTAAGDARLLQADCRLNAEAYARQRAKKPSRGEESFTATQLSAALGSFFSADEAARREEFLELLRALPTSDTQ